MKIIDLEQGSEEWLDYRKGKISGTMLGDLYSKRGGRKIGFYEIIAQRLGLEPDEENRMDRGLRLEDEATAIFEEKTGLKTVKAGLCVSSINPNIINSPDRLIEKNGKYLGAVEIKCISPARHLQAVIEDKIPDEFEPQIIQYFIVNDDLETLFFVFYDPRVPAVPYFMKEVRRIDVVDQIEALRVFQLQQLKEIDEIIERLAF